MSNEKLLREIENLLSINPGSITIDKNLKDIEEWDSMALITFIAMIDSEYGKVVSATELRNCITVADLINFMK